MKKTLLTLILSFILFSAFGQKNYDGYRLDDTLLKVKNVLEKCIINTNIRDLNIVFSITQTKSSGYYVFEGEVLKMLPGSKVKLINAKLNRVLKKYRDLKLDGTVFFDRYLDSSLVYIEYHKPEKTYDFISSPRPLEPSEGYPDFSKQLHDVIKAKIRQGIISKDSINEFKTIDFYINQSGLITRNDNAVFKKELDSFFMAKKWKRDPFNSSPVAALVQFKLDKRYLLTGDHWYGRSIKSSGFVVYGDEWATLHLIAPFDKDKKTTFYSDVLPEKKWRYSAIISMVYDNHLKKYCRPVVHAGSLEETAKLIAYLSEHQNYFKAYFNRVYIYR